MDTHLDVLFEDNHLLIVNKTSGLVTQGASKSEKSLLQIAKDYLRKKYHKPGNVYLGVMSRLDAVVSGVVVLARTSKAAARLTEQFRTRAVQKFYLALIPSTLPVTEGTWRDWILKDDRAARMVSVPKGTRGAVEAILHYRVKERLPHGDLLEIQLETGRKHQIRLQCAEHAEPILGDKKYGSRASFPVGIALHASRLVLQHPTTKEVLSVVAPLPRYWPRVGTD